jgi:CelD/BcsL family acetyltransferase involved in cellulose biosynthesis
VVHGEGLERLYTALDVLSMGLAIRRIDKARDFMALAPIWSRLVNDSGQTSPFLSYDWFWCCWHGVWPQRRPEILVVEDMGAPVAIVPLMHWRAWAHGLPVRYLSFLECPHTPMVDLVIADQRDRVIEMVLDHLASRADWDVVWLQRVPATSPTVNTLEKLLPGRFHWRRTGHWRSPYVAIDSDWEHFRRTMNGHVADAQQHSYEQLRRSGDMRIEEHRTIDLQSPFIRETLAAISRGSQTTNGVASALMPRAAEFFRELTRRAAKNGWLSLWALRLDGRVVALEYQLRASGKVLVLWAGGDSDRRGFLPEMALNLAILQAFFESGCVYEYAVGPGVHDDRRLWATGWHETVHLKLYRPSFYARLLHWLEAARASEGR